MVCWTPPQKRGRAGPQDCAVSSTVRSPFLQEQMKEAACVKGNVAARQHGSMPIWACSGPSYSGSASFFTAPVRLEGKRTLGCTSTLPSLHKGSPTGLLSGGSLLLTW